MAIRCTHAMLRGLCVVRDCSHFDGAKTGAQKIRSVHSHPIKRPTRRKRVAQKLSGRSV